MAITKVKKVVGGLGSFPGSEGTTGQVLTKLSNTPGDYGWSTLPTVIQSRIQNTNNTSYVQIAQSGTESIDFFTENTLRMSIRAAGISNLAAINGNPVASLVNPADAPSTYVGMTDPGVINSNRAWTSNKLQTLINGTVDLDGAVPPGMVMPFAGPFGNIPPNWLQCDGSRVRAADYPELNDAIGYLYTGPGETATVSSIGSQVFSAQYGTSATSPTIVEALSVDGDPDFLRVISKQSDATTINWSTDLMTDNTSNLPVTVHFAYVYGLGNVCVGASSTGAPYTTGDMVVFHLDNTGVVTSTFSVPFGSVSVSQVGRRKHFVDETGDL